MLNFNKKQVVKVSNHDFSTMEMWSGSLKDTTLGPLREAKQATVWPSQLASRHSVLMNLRFVYSAREHSPFSRTAYHPVSLDMTPRNAGHGIGLTLAGLRLNWP